MDAITITPCMSRLLKAARHLLEEAQPRLAAISIRAMTSPHSQDGPNPDFDDDVDPRGLAGVDVIYHQADNPQDELHEPNSPTELVHAFVIERERGAFVSAVYDAAPTVFHAAPFTVVIGLDRAAMVPGLVAAAFPYEHSLHHEGAEEAIQARYLPLVAEEQSAHDLIAVAAATQHVLRRIANSGEPDTRDA